MKKIIILVIAFLAITVTCMAKTVIATGYGTDRLSAERDALRQAIENSRLYVSSTSITKDYKATSDVIITKAQAYITDYKVLESTNTKVKIQAEVNNKPDSMSMTDLVKKGIIETSLGNPAISVNIPDQAGAEVVQALTNAGFKVSNLNPDIVIRAILVDRHNNGDVGQFLGAGHVGTTSVSTTVAVEIDFKGKIYNSSATAKGVAPNAHMAFSSAMKKAGEQLGSNIIKTLLDVGSGPLLINGGIK